MEGLSHTGFIAAAYGICFAVLGGLALYTLLRARSARVSAARLEDVNPRRRQRQQTAKQ